MQLPALILPGVTLVISPLVALMVDQLQHLPTIIPGSLLTGGQVAASKICLCLLYIPCGFIYEIYSTFCQ
jgi:hypothetical protein